MRFKDIKHFTKSAEYHTTVPWDYIEKTLARYNENGLMELDSEFQRAHVWDETRQSRYVEYILKGGKSSRDIYWNQRGWMRKWDGPLYLVDGKQRLQAVRKFLLGELSIFGNLTINDFSDSVPWDASFEFHVNDLQTYGEVLQWYLDLNDGGIAHTPEELGKVRQLLEQEKAK
jgi:hypothetical protein